MRNKEEIQLVVSTIVIDCFWTAKGGPYIGGMGSTYIVFTRGEGSLWPPTPLVWVAGSTLISSEEVVFSEFTQLLSASSILRESPPTHPLTHMCTHTHTHTQRERPKHTHTHTHTHTHIHTHTHTEAQTHTHMHTQAHTHNAHAHTHTHAHTHMHTHTHTHMHTQAHTHKHTHNAHARNTHTHTHTHTHNTHNTHTHKSCINFKPLLYKTQNVFIMVYLFCWWPTLLSFSG